MKLHAIEVLGPGGAVVSVRAGTPWPAPYVGSQYSVRRGGGMSLVGWKRDPLAVRSEPYPRSLAETVRAVRGGNGSFRITSHRAVITKVPVDAGLRWEPLYVGLYDDDLVFPGIDNAPQSLERGMYWTGLPFLHGEQTIRRRWRRRSRTIDRC